MVPFVLGDAFPTASEADGGVAFSDFGFRISGFEFGFLISDFEFGLAAPP
jgi:hypothetical protein